MDPGRSPKPVPPPSSSPGVARRQGDSTIRWGRIAVTFFVLSLVLSGCGTAAFSDQDVRLQPAGDTLYLLTRSDGVSRNLCAGLGGDVARVEGRAAAAEGKAIQIGRVGGCYTVRHIIVCPEGDVACVAHEERHRLEGAFHR